MIKLGISAFYHDSAACITINGKVIAAAEEERFTKIKHDYSFPKNAITWCLRHARVNIEQINEIHWYESPEKKDDRVRTTFAKKPFRTFFLNRKYKKSKSTQDPKNILESMGYTGKIYYHSHHDSHAAFAYYTSDYDHSAILTVDGVGEWETTTISVGRGNEIKKILSIDFPNSLGMLYSTITSYLGFKPNEGEYKVMGLAPYGNPLVYKDKLNKVLDNSTDKFTVDQKYFTWEYSDKIMFNKNLCRLLDLAPRLPGEDINQEHKDLAAALQTVYEEQFVKLLKLAKKVSKSKNICLGGGCAYNGVANKLAYNFFKSIHVPFAPSDAGSAIGVCLNKHTKVSPYLGPYFRDFITKRVLDNYKNKLIFFPLSDAKLLNKVANYICNQKIVAWYQGRMEFGARALGNRSILASPRDPNMREKLNMVIKKREGFRPFAPSVLEKHAHKYFDIKEPVPYMNVVTKTKVNYLPAATHIDGTSRVQTVNKEQNYKFYRLIEKVGRLSGVPVVLNTSFNLKDQTITLSPSQAIERYLSSQIDVLVIDNFLILKQ